MKQEKINMVPIDNTRKIIFTLIIIICIIAIAFALYNQYYKEEKLGLIIGINTDEEKRTEEISELKSNFNSIFDNTVTGEYDNLNYEKIDSNKEIIYSNYIVNKEENNYTLDIKLPSINIKGDTVDEINKEINETFLSKAIQIVKSNTDVNMIFSVSYKGYVKDNVLSIVIKGELKEGTSSQRILIQTYNYNIENNKKIVIYELLNIKGITEKDADNYIKEEIEQKQNQSSQLSELGYETYNREYDKQIHSIKNTTEFFMDNNSNLYIIYPYGNNDETSEMDLIIF